MNKILRIKDVPPFGNFTRDFGHVTYFIPKGLTKKNSRAGGIMVLCNYLKRQTNVEAISNHSGRWLLFYYKGFEVFTCHFQNFFPNQNFNHNPRFLWMIPSYAFFYKMVMLHYLRCPITFHRFSSQFFYYFHGSLFHSNLVHHWTTSQMDTFFFVILVWYRGCEWLDHTAPSQTSYSLITGKHNLRW